MTHTSRRKLFFGPLKWASLAALVSVGTLFASLAGLYSASKDKAVQDRDLASKPTLGSRQATDLSEQVSTLRRDLATNTANLNALALALQNRQESNGVESKSVGMRPEERSEIDGYEETQKQLALKVSTLESALNTSPEKAVAVPILRQQLTDTQDRFKNDMDETHAEFGRLYALVQWAFALIVTIILGFCGVLLAQVKSSHSADKTMNRAA